MGIASLGGLLSGAGNVSAPNTRGVGRDYLGLLNSFLSGFGPTFQAQSQYQPQYASLQTGTIAGQVPGATGIINSANPAQANLLQSLNQSASEGVQAGANMDPGLMTVLQNSLRGGQAARGLGFGPSDAVTESAQMTQFGNQLRQQRQGFASNVAGMNNNYVTQPAIGLASGAAGAGPSLTPNAMQLLTMPYQGRLQAAGQTAANTTGLYQSMDSNQSSFVGGL